MPYAWIIASCSVGCLLSDCSLDLAFPHLWLSLSSLPLVWQNDLLTLCAFPLYFGVPPLLNSGIALSSLVNSGIACLASQSSDWLDALWASLSSV